jgi:hypothetical protein|tara:strand:- start:190 stop:339 length:150 start_codon:yes stop_codon:yes gene_type:complete
LSLSKEEIRQKHKEERAKDKKNTEPKKRVAGDPNLSLSSYDEPSEEGNE